MFKINIKPRRPIEERQRIKEDKRKAEEQERQSMKQEASENAQKMAEDRKAARQEGRQYADEMFNRNIAGLNPAQRQAMEESGKHKINREMQGHERNLLAKQGRSGVRGGAAYAQHADLARAGMEAQGQMQRDITNLDSDLALKKLAAMFNVEQGEAAQSQLDRQLALDELKYEQEKKRQRMLEDQFNRQFSKV